MIPNTHRFHGPNSLNYVYRTGRNARGSLFGVKTSPNQRRTTYRVAVVVSRKVNKSAVARNRIRRRLYAAVRQMNINGPHDVVITVFSSAILDEPARGLENQLKKQLIQAGVL